MATEKEVIAAVAKYNELSYDNQGLLIDLAVNSITRENDAPAVRKLTEFKELEKLVKDEYAQKELHKKMNKGQTDRVDLVRYILTNTCRHDLEESECWLLILELMKRCRGFIWRPPCGGRGDHYWPQLKRHAPEVEELDAKRRKECFRIFVGENEDRSTVHDVALGDEISVGGRDLTVKAVDGVIQLQAANGFTIVLDKPINDVDSIEAPKSEDEDFKDEGEDSENEDSEDLGGPYIIVADSGTFKQKVEPQELRLVVYDSDATVTDSRCKLAHDMEVCIGNHDLTATVVDGVVHLKGGGGFECVLDKLINDVPAFRNWRSPQDPDYDPDYEDLKGPYLVMVELE